MSLSGLDSLRVIIEYLHKGFAFGEVEKSKWRILISRGNEKLIVFHKEDLNQQVFKEKWPDYDSHNSTQLIPLSPRYFKLVGGKIAYIKEEQIKDIARGILGCEGELESILKEVFKKT
ncbi:hypothetical protein [Pseudoalteromonas maricaloris]|uniref:Uncharacterized protein n=1 Tax=Pseudoalteromonas maricaloris TaxID=184924 RepID=A0A8I2KMJ4_9GAMM|nr:hypothetical protein [Pseudoalteromonas maricaloris]NLR21771.1 hypothetical protein [Pseudoalteromonas maricaloris]WOX28311.1 hypothetical protein R5H13_17035 [Pseudoalteromonas maricaloris]